MLRPSGREFAGGRGGGAGLRLLYPGCGPASSQSGRKAASSLHRCGRHCSGRCRWQYLRSCV
ncbi:hypothetical protein JOB18_036971 [Solea senegalensis]|nr:hypothetical protein JOB18_036971 [Solea senegalensis]